jgi:putative transposase
MRTDKYPSDISDEQWALIEPLIPVYPGGRPRKTDLRDVVDALFYLLRTGCQWRYLPKDFPPRSTVWRYFDEWRHNGTLEKIHDSLRTKVRTQEKPYAPRTTASVDSQSVDTTSGGQQRGRDNAKNVDGRKRHIVVDSMGLLLAVRKVSVIGCAGRSEVARSVCWPRATGQQVRYPSLRQPKAVGVRVCLLIGVVLDVCSCPLACSL